MSLGTMVTTSELTMIFLAHHELQTEQEVKESYKWAESPKTHLLFLFIEATQVFREKPLSGGVEFEAILRFGEAVSLVWEEHILVLDALAFHDLDNLLRFALLYAWIIRSLTDEDGNLYLINLEQGGAGFQKLLLGIRVTDTLIKDGKQGCPVWRNSFNQRYQIAGSDDIHGTAKKVGRESGSHQGGIATK